MAELKRHETPEEWAIRTRREQGLPDHLENLAVLLELADLVVKAEEEARDER